MLFCLSDCDDVTEDSDDKDAGPSSDGGRSPQPKRPADEDQTANVGNGANCVVATNGDVHCDGANGASGIVCATNPSGGVDCTQAGNTAAR